MSDVESSWPAVLYSILLRDEERRPQILSYMWSRARLGLTYYVVVVDAVDR
jgi:hypothetical protein